MIASGMVILTAGYTAIYIAIRRLAGSQLNTLNLLHGVPDNVATKGK